MYSSSLKGKNAWVTGSSRGIGRIVAEFLAECGANVAIHGRNATNLAQYGEGETLEAVAEEMAERFGVRIVPVCGNLGREEEAARAAATVRSKLGEPDILVCCAGGTNVEGVRDKSILEFESGYFRGIMDMNLYPSVFCCREIVPEMMRRENGSVVLIGSIAGCGGWKTGGALAAYPLAKSAIQRVCALSCRPYAPFRRPRELCDSRQHQHPAYTSRLWRRPCRPSARIEPAGTRGKTGRYCLARSLPLLGGRTVYFRTVHSGRRRRTAFSLLICFRRLKSAGNGVRYGIGK